MTLLAYDPQIESTDERLILVTPDISNAAIHNHLVQADRVHKIDNTDELRCNYLGWGDAADPLQEGASNKLAFALVAGPHVRSIIYALMTTIPEVNGAIRFRDIPGDTAAIRAMPSTPIQDPKAINAVLFYAISNVADAKADPGSRGSGRRLIQHVYNTFNNLPVLRSTVSPTPGSGRWVSDHAGESITDKKLRRLLTVRATENIDAVGKFHLSNGAFIGDANLMPCAPGDPDGINGRKATINYVYADPATTERLSHAYNDHGIIAMAWPLTDKLPGNRRDNILPVAHEIFPRAANAGFDIGFDRLMQLVEKRTARLADSGINMSEELRPSLSV